VDGAGPEPKAKTKLKSKQKQKNHHKPAAIAWGEEFMWNAAGQELKAQQRTIEVAESRAKKNVLAADRGNVICA